MAFECSFPVSVIIPVYNQQDHIRRCVESLKKQTIGFDNIELILINDGSEDDSGSICEELSRMHDNIIYIDQVNKGVSAARNAGIKRAGGKYIFFADSDDELSRETIKKVSEFFDEHYDEVDLVTYKIDTIYEGELLNPHFRYRYLRKSGVYSLVENFFIGQTTMNIAVKNMFDKNVLFDEEQSFSEDQKYCCDILSRKLHMGFCSEGRYIYYRSDQSSSGKLSGACYIFEQCMEFFEKLFEKYSYVPRTFQGLYVNDIYWKLMCNILLPYHYDKEGFERAMARIKRLLCKCEDEAIITHPNIDFFEKYYMLRLKENNRLQYYLGDGFFDIFDDHNLLLRQNDVEIVITKLNVIGDRLRISGFLKTVFFHVYAGDTKCFALENGKDRISMELKDSANNYYMSHEKTQRFKAFDYEGDLKKLKDLRFEVVLNDRVFKTSFYFMPLTPFVQKDGVQKRRMGDYIICKNRDDTFSFEKSSDKRSGEVWLYYDCAGIKKDNGLLQFEHDIQKNDGIKRYYIVTDDRQINADINPDSYVRFGSGKHKSLLKECSKILTAFIELNNLFPYKYEELDKSARDFNFEVIYLQHGVLHIDMPWKYSKERLPADRVVVSARQEAEFLKSVGYKDSELIKTGMPRFKGLIKKPSRKRILFAPSWRAYLVGRNIDNKWQPRDGKFLNSDFFIQTEAFLNSEELHEMLKSNGYHMDVKLHPIFDMYKKYYNINSEYIHIDGETFDDGEYDLMITDFSSYAFNFMYMSIPVMHFIPDRDEFKCGMNGYRRMSNDEEFWKYTVCESKELIKNIRGFFEDKKVEQEQIDFFDIDDCCNDIYNEVRQEAK